MNSPSSFFIIGFNVLRGSNIREGYSTKGNINLRVKKIKMKEKTEILEQFILYRKKISEIIISQAARDRFVSVVHELISYLKKRDGFEVMIDGIEQEIIMVDNKRKQGWKPGTKGERYFNQSKREVLDILESRIIGIEIQRDGLSENRSYKVN